ncbi:MAG TPA: methylmalonyl-CoA mutase family protein [Candidatus Dormibacteraeota bacterium]|nr:methylmalonyl-CoA mutase family protein [Candidatus Dormibacteraeota bacterium]
MVRTESGLPLDPVYLPGHPEPPPPGVPPFTRGVRADGYRSRRWTMRQYAGFGSAAETNRRFHYLLERGQTGLSTAFDLPTQMGYDSDDPMAAGEVGRVGVPIDSLTDMEVLLEGIPLDRVTTSMTINAPASLLLLLYELAAERQGIPAAALGGTIQNDILKEYAARGTYIFPPRPSMRLVTDTLAYCRDHLPRWNPISISGYHIREAGATAPQELAFTLADGIAYVEAALAAGLVVEEFAPRLSFFFNVGNDFFEEVAKFRCARQLWAGIMRERFGATTPRAQALRFHAQTGGATLTAQQPLNNVVRVALQALAAVCGGAQSLHTNGYDEALALPSEAAATVALRTQQILAEESGVAAVADPLGGAHLVEDLTERLAVEATALIEEVDRRGGAVAAIEQGFYQAAIQESAYRLQQATERGARVTVGVNRYRDAGESVAIPVLRVGPELEREQVASLQARRAARDGTAVEQALDAVRRTAAGSENLLPVMRQALALEATVGEVCSALRDVFGRYRPPSTL